MNQLVHLLGYASSVGGVDPGCGEGPLSLRKSFDLPQHAALRARCHWDAMIRPALSGMGDKTEVIRELCAALASHTAALTRQKEFFMVLGGDHTSALGTWSGVFEGLHQQGSLGLIWVDAHMDSHVPETSLSGRFHGMPLAALLGYGNPLFTQLVSPSPKINPEKLCLLGVRSYEEGEAELLKQLGVRVYFMEEINKRGLAAVFKEAVQWVNQDTAGFGISVDLDSLDPQDAPGVDVPAPFGLRLKDLCEALGEVAHDPHWVGAEIVEFNPSKDIQQITEKAVFQLIAAMIGHAQR